ncbi:MAG: DUF2284 domain-containing protein [Chloroflexi bacterium]|nr:DUF2284 domain-containing protein [Chloroflexota bacterium]
MKSQPFEFINSLVEILRAERYERFLPVAEIEHSRRFQEMCRTCPRYGKNLSCPPNTPDFIEYVGESSLARIICFQIYLANPQTTTVEQQLADVRQAGKLLAEELGLYLKQGHRVAGTGGCRSCETCAGEVGETFCRRPAERIFSLEAMGVDVGALLKRSFDIELEWNRGGQRASYLCTAGAIFYDANLTST